MASEQIIEKDMEDTDTKFEFPLPEENVIDTGNLSSIQNTYDIWHATKLIVIFILKLIVVCVAIYLCWDCNRNSNIILRIIMTTFSAIFSELYIIYYSFYRILLGNKCY
jgi:hypothetical protein